MEPVLLINSLEAGGLERVCVTLCNEWHAQNKRFKLICFNAGGALEQEVQTGIDLEIWDCRTRSALPQLRKLIKKTTTETPFLVFSTDIAALLGAMKILHLCPNPVIYREPNAARAVQSLKRRAIYHFVGKLDGYIAQTQTTASELHAAMRASAGVNDRITVIPNPSRFVVGRESLHVRIPPPSGRLNCLAVGRLMEQKGYDRLTKAFRRVVDIFPGAHLRIAGDGPLRSLIQDDVKRLSLQQQVKLLGHVADVASHYDSADVLILSSYFEGLPNVVIEALALGCPVIAAAGKGGTTEFLTQIGLSDFLVHGNFESGLPKAIESLLHSNQSLWNRSRAAMVDMVQPRRVAEQFWRTLESYELRPHLSAVQASMREHP